MSDYGKNNATKEAAVSAVDGTALVRSTKRGTVVNGPFVKIHAEPDLASKAIVVKKEGERMIIKKQVGDFWMVEVDGFPGGYILADHFKEES